MPVPHSFIIVKGQPKAILIEKIELVERGVYAIKYKNNVMGTGELHQSKIKLNKCFGFLLTYSYLCSAYESATANGFTSFAEA